MKLLQVPKISNTNRSDLAVEFVRWDQLAEEDKEAFEKITAIVKDRSLRLEGINVGKLKPTEVVNRVKSALPGTGFTMHTHTSLHQVLGVRPPSGAEDPFNTDTAYCHYDEAHSDYLYQDEWPELIINLLQSGRVSVEDIHNARRDGEQWDINLYAT